MKRKVMGIIASVLAVATLLGVIIYDALKKDERFAEKSDVIMGTIVSQRVYADNEQIVESISNEIKRLENDVLSWRVDSSAVNNLNSVGEVENAELASYIDEIYSLQEESDGRFDLTCGGLTRLWGIGTDSERLPKQDEIDAVLPYCDYKGLKTDGSSVKVGQGQWVDMGAVGKGIACDRACDILKKENARGAVISVGGSIVVYGNRGKSDKWTVGIRNPLSENVTEQFATLKVSNCFISTSGSYEKYFDVDGRRYHHILDAKTGYPCDSGELVGVTVISGSGIMSDALSTVCFINGWENSLDVLEKYNAQAVFVYSDKTVRATSGIRSSLEISDNSFILGD